MEAKELMIGDWYRNLEYGVRQWTIDDYTDINTEYIEPVILHTQMLTANGFEWNEGLTQYELHLRDERAYIDAFHCELGWIIDVSNHYDMYADSCHKIVKCVHELQHCLRLCGLDDIADNFVCEI